MHDKEASRTKHIFQNEKNSLFECYLLIINNHLKSAIMTVKPEKIKFNSCIFM